MGKPAPKKAAKPATKSTSKSTLGPASKPATKPQQKAALKTKKNQSARTKSAKPKNDTEKKAPPVAPIIVKASPKILSAAPRAKVTPKSVLKTTPPLSDAKGPKAQASKSESRSQIAESKLDRTKLLPDQKKWLDLYERHRGEKAPEYNIRQQFGAKTPIQHPLFGWGFILSNEYDRLEILFKEGTKLLISNRKI